jgi:hypothetical protein
MQECLGPDGVVESAPTPLVLSEQEKASLRREPRERWGRGEREMPPETAEEVTSKRRAADEHSEAVVAEEEADYRAEIYERLEAEGLVNLLADADALRRLDAVMRSAACVSQTAPPPRWFVDKCLMDVREGGYASGLADGEFAAVARCCGTSWASQERLEAISFVRCYMVDVCGWPQQMRGRLLDPARVVPGYSEVCVAGAGVNGDVSASSSRPSRHARA